MLRPKPIAAAFGRNQKRISLAFLGIGLSSFFVQLIRAAPSVMGRTRWSLFSIVWQISHGKLQHSITDPFIAPIEIAVIYLLLIIFWPEFLDDGGKVGCSA